MKQEYDILRTTFTKEHTAVVTSDVDIVIPLFEGQISAVKGQQIQPVNKSFFSTSIINSVKTVDGLIRLAGVEIKSEYADGLVLVDNIDLKLYLYDDTVGPPAGVFGKLFADTPLLNSFTEYSSIVPSIGGGGGNKFGLWFMHSAITLDTSGVRTALNGKTVRLEVNATLEHTYPLEAF